MNDHELRKEILMRYDYNPVTGGLISRLNGQEIQSHSRKGYLRFRIFRNSYYIHRVAFLIMEGRWPHQIDHLNRNCQDNRWENLVESDQNGNAQNHSLRCTNQTGRTGVEYNSGKGFRASMVRNGVRRRGRWVQTFEQAVEDRADLERGYEAKEWGHPY